ncbi:TetR/AcrR family transcriptional regulator [Streptomyces albus]|uniref:TetR/AcrR family transcriptional regulator n=1 Tax=Streptomyces sp. PHES57 TaxID=2872626 RepID=UPI001CEDB027|nr:TetR/AcrR family transcriptional regulator [Streptomyces sp. PHES57]
MTESRRRRPRADAQRNRDRLLAEAEAVFRQEGTDASLERIARRAGVAIGTLYGHFPSRRALIGALLRERNEALFARGRELLAGPEPGRALARWVDAMVEHATAYRGLAAVLAEGLCDQESELHTCCRELITLSGELLATARADGALRREVTGADIFALMSAVAWVRGQLPAEQADRLMSLTMDGILSPSTR